MISMPSESWPIFFASTGIYPDMILVQLTIDIVPLQQYKWPEVIGTYFIDHGNQ